MLELTGFVLPDVGILTLTVMAGKDDPAQVTAADLDRAADDLQAFYSRGIGNSLAAGVVFPNSGFVQAAFDKPQFQFKKQAWADFVLRGHRASDMEPVLVALDKKEYREMVLRGDDSAARCAFTGQPAYLRVSRDMLPMINGRGIMNFSPMGDAGLPVSDVILLAIHALPLGCVITQGALLAVESDDRQLMFEFAKTNLETNRRFIHLANENGYEKFPNLSSYKTRLMDVLVKALAASEARLDPDAYRAPSLNAYHFSNNGTSARVSIYALPSSTVQFVWDAGRGDHAVYWQRIVASGRTEQKSRDEELAQKSPKLTQRNLIYEDLFDLPENARDFLRTYFLRHALRKFKGDPRGEYNSFTEADLISWKLTALFLRRIMNMDIKRIDQLKFLGDQLAEYIVATDERRLLKALYNERRYSVFRLALLRAINKYALIAPNGSAPLVPFDTYVKIFEEGEEFERSDWNLARDLLLIRIFEQLHSKGYLSQAANDLQTDDESDEDDSN